MAERIERDATGQARIVGEPDLPLPPIIALDAWTLRGPSLFEDRLRLELMDPKRIVRCVSVW